MTSGEKKMITTNDQTIRYLDMINGLLKQYGILLESDKSLPSAIGAIVGKPVSGSWWGHPKGMLAYNVLKRFSVQPDVLTVKLLAGKTTFVHPRFWPSLLTAATSGEQWQRDRLSEDEKRLFEAVIEKGELRTDEHAKTSQMTVGRLGESARGLEKRLLVYGEGFHSTLGAHAKRLETWDKWANKRRYSWSRLDLSAAKKSLETARDNLLAPGVAPRLPWEPKSGTKRAS